MDNRLLRDYARLIARVGGHVVKGDEVWIGAGLDQPEFIEMLVEECYKAGAKHVRVKWSHDPLAKLHYKYMTLGELSKVDSIEIARLKYFNKHLLISYGLFTFLEKIEEWCYMKE